MGRRTPGRTRSEQNQPTARKADKDRTPTTTRTDAHGKKNTVPMLERIFAPHLDNLQRALSRAAERHALLTTNLANLNTPGYKRQDLDFNLVLDEQTGKAIERIGAFRQAADLDSDSGSIRLDGNNVDLEKEVMSIAETELRYQALADFATQYFAGLKNVIREGR